MNAHPKSLVRSAACLLGLAATASAQVTQEPSMLRGDTAATGQGWSVTPLFTVGETLGSYLPVGLLDGIGAFSTQNPNVAQILVNHELNEPNGYPYTLDNGTVLNGARVSSMLLLRSVDESTGAVSVTLRRAGLAYGTVHDRKGVVVTDPAQINETGLGMNGFARFCSSRSAEAGTYGFVDDLYFTGEESGKPFLPHGGSVWAIDVATRTMWAAPALGRGAWENVCPLDTGDASTIALLLGDDTQSAPLYLYVGTKNAAGDGSFLDRNGLASGKLYGWRANAGDLSSDTFFGVDEGREGTWVELTNLDAAMAGLPGWDDQGYADIDTLQSQADALGCFSFSRPEDIHDNPLDGTQAIFASTGRGSVFPNDNWGTLYVVDTDFSDLSADLVIVHDADGLANPDDGIRSPDNLVWAFDGKVYVQEDKSTSPGSLFGATNGIEASVWSLDPVTRAYTRIAEIDRSVVVPAGVTDGGAGEVGNWETSGILDITHLVGTLPGERLLIADVEAHGIQDGVIGGDSMLGEGGQLVLLSKIGQ